MEISVKNKFFHTQDLCLCTNLRCAKNSARMEINMHKFLRAVGLSDIKKEELEKICKDIEEMNLLNFVISLATFLV